MIITEMTTEERRHLLAESKKRVLEAIENFCLENPKFAGYVRSCPASMQNQYIETLKPSNKSKARAVKMKCLECSGWQREEVKNCVVKSCPLWVVRPFQK